MDYRLGCELQLTDSSNAFNLTMQLTTDERYAWAHRETMANLLESCATGSRVQVLLPMQVLEVEGPLSISDHIKRIMQHPNVQPCEHLFLLIKHQDMDDFFQTDDNLLYGFTDFSRQWVEDRDGQLTSHTDVHGAAFFLIKLPVKEAAQFYLRSRRDHFRRNPLERTDVRHIRFRIICLVDKADRKRQADGTKERIRCAQLAIPQTHSSVLEYRNGLPPDPHYAGAPRREMLLSFLVYVGTSSAFLLGPMHWASLSYLKARNLTIVFKRTSHHQLLTGLESTTR